MSASSLSCLPFVLLLVLRPPSATLTDTLLPYTTLFRSVRLFCRVVDLLDRRHPVAAGPGPVRNAVRPAGRGADPDGLDQPAGARHLGRDDRTHRVYALLMLVVAGFTFALPFATTFPMLLLSGLGLGLAGGPFAVGQRCVSSWLTRATNGRRSCGEWE